jgi:hypothetical protein
MRTLLDVADYELRHADWVNAVDEETGHWETLWGLDEPAAVPAAKNRRIIEVAVPEGDQVGLLNLIDRVEQVKGRLPPRIEALREVLKRSTADTAPADSEGNLVIGHS